VFTFGLQAHKRVAVRHDVLIESARLVSKQTSRREHLQTVISARTCTSHYRCANVSKLISVCERIQADIENLEDLNAG